MSEKEERRSSEEYEDEEIPAPPDGGYGWVVVFASFMCNMVVDGIAYTFGIFLPQLVLYFGKGEGTVAWIGSLLPGCTMLVGPIVSALANKFGCRAVCITGAVVAATGFVISSYSSSVTMMMVTYGVVGGLGSGMIYLPAVVAVGYYFETKRSLATGLAVCGSGVGTFAFGPLATVLLNQLGSWQNANLVLAGLLLSCALFGALMKPLTHDKKKPLLQRMAEEKQKHMEYSSMNGSYFVVQLADGTTEKRAKALNVDPGVHSYANLEALGKSPTSPNMVRVATGNALLAHEGKKPKLSDVENGMFVSKASVTGHPEKKMVRPMSRKDIFYSGSVVNLPQYQSQKSLQGYRNSVISLPASRIAEDPHTASNCCPCIRLPLSFQSALSSMLDVSLLTDLAFMLIGLSNIFSMAGLYVPFVYIAAIAQVNGVPESSANILISIIGITNVFARIGCGFIADFPWVNALLLNNMCLILATVTIAVIPYCASFGAYIAVAVSFGIATAGYISLTSIILVDLLGLEKLTNAFGLMILFRGVAAIIGSPLAGAVKDATNSYDASFYMAAAFFGIAAVTSFVAPLFRKKLEPVHMPVPLSPISEDQEDPEDPEDTPITMGNKITEDTKQSFQKESVL